MGVMNRFMNFLGLKRKKKLWNARFWPRRKSRWRQRRLIIGRTKKRQYRKHSFTEEREGCISGASFI